MEHFTKLAELGRDLPAGYLRRPEVEPEGIPYWDAFWELSTDRQVGMGTGPIPFSALDRYADRFGLSAPDDFDRFRAIVRAMDDAYLSHKSSSISGATFEVSADDPEGVRSVLFGNAKKLDS